MAGRQLNPMQKLAAAWVAGGAKEMPIGYPSTSDRLAPYWYLPAGYVDTAKVGDGRGNSIVESALSVLGNGLAEAPAVVMDVTDGQEVPQLVHPLTQLLAEPNPYVTGELLWTWTIAATKTHGDAYWFKVRSRAGRVVELWPLPPDMIEPEDGEGALATPEERAAHSAGAGAFIAYYQYTVNGRIHRLEASDVVHLRDGINPDNPRKGTAPLRTVLREVLADEEAGQFAAAMLRNMGVPGVVLSPNPNHPDDPGPDDDQADDIVDRWEQRFGGQNRGRPLVMTGGRWQIDRVAFTPSEMDFRQLRRVPEERVTGVLGVPAILAQLGAGLDRAINANARELREFFTEQTLGPHWRRYGATITNQLGRPDFGLTANQRVAFDLSGVRALQADEDALFTRWLAAVEKGAATVADFRNAVGLPVTPADEVYLRPVSQLEIPVGETTAAAVREAEALLAGSEG